MAHCLTYKLKCPLVYINTTVALEQKRHCSIIPTPETVICGTGRTDTSQILFICPAGNQQSSYSDPEAPYLVWVNLPCKCSIDVEL